VDEGRSSLWAYSVQLRQTRNPLSSRGLSSDVEMRVPRCKSRSGRLALMPQSRNRELPALHARTAGIVLASGRVGEWASAGERGWIGHASDTKPWLRRHGQYEKNVVDTKWSFPGIEAAQVCRHASAHCHVHSTQFTVHVSRWASRVCLVALSAFSWCQV
jgi:hypothetical protein